MTLRIRDSRPPTTETAVAKLEKRLKHRLPPDYRAFLLAHNGGVPDPPTFALPGERKPTQVLNSFLALGGEPDVDDLSEFLKTYRRRLPAGFLPVAYDAFGNLIIIALADGKRGQVYFWDHEREQDGDPLRLVAGDWKGFLDSFRPA